MIFISVGFGMGRKYIGLNEGSIGYWGIISMRDRTHAYLRGTNNFFSHSHSKLTKSDVYMALATVVITEGTKH